MSWYYIILYNICHGMYECVCTYMYIYILYYTIYIYIQHIYMCVQIYDNILYIIIQCFFSTHKACHVANIFSRLKAWVSGEGANSFPRSPQVGHLHRLFFRQHSLRMTWLIFEHLINMSAICRQLGDPRDPQSLDDLKFHGKLCEYYIISHDGSGWCWYIDANMTEVFVDNIDGIHVTVYLAAPWIPIG